MRVARASSGTCSRASTPPASRAPSSRCARREKLSSQCGGAIAACRLARRPGERTDADANPTYRVRASSQLASRGAAGLRVARRARLPRVSRTALSDARGSKASHACSCGPRRVLPLPSRATSASSRSPARAPAWRFLDDGAIRRGRGFECWQGSQSSAQGKFLEYGGGRPQLLWRSGASREPERASILAVAVLCAPAGRTRRALGRTLCAIAGKALCALSFVLNSFICGTCSMCRCELECCLGFHDRVESSGRSAPLSGWFCVVSRRVFSLSSRKG